MCFFLFCYLPFCPKPGSPATPGEPICPSLPLWPGGPSEPGSPAQKEENLYPVSVFYVNWENNKDDAPVLPFGPLGPSNPGWPICPGGPYIHEKYHKVSLCRNQNIVLRQFGFQSYLDSQEIHYHLEKPHSQLLIPAYTHWYLFKSAWIEVQIPSPFCPRGPESPKKKVLFLWVT